MKNKKENAIIKKDNSYLKWFFSFLMYPIRKPIHALTYLLLFNQIIKTIAQPDAGATQSNLIENSSNLLDVYQLVQQKMYEATYSRTQNKYQEVNDLLDHYLAKNSDNVFLLESKIKFYFYNTVNVDFNLTALLPFADKLLKIDSDNEWALAFKLIFGIVREVKDQATQNLARRLQQLRPQLSIGYYARGMGKIYLADNSEYLELALSGKEDLETAIKIETAGDLISLYQKTLNKILENGGAILHLPKKFQNSTSEKQVFNSDAWFNYFIAICILILTGAGLTKLLYAFNARREEQKKLQAKQKLANSLVEYLNESHKVITNVLIWTANKATIVAKTDLFLTSIDAEILGKDFRQNNPMLKRLSFDSDKFLKLWLEKLQKIFGRENIEERMGLVKITINRNHGRLLRSEVLRNILCDILEIILKESPELKLAVLKQRIQVVENDYIKKIADSMQFFAKQKQSLKNYEDSATNYQTVFSENKFIVNKSIEILRIINSINIFVKYHNSKNLNNNNNNLLSDEKNNSLVKEMLSFENNLQALKCDIAGAEQAKTTDYKTDLAQINKIAIKFNQLVNLERGIIKAIVSYKNNYSNIQIFYDEIITASNKLKQKKQVSKNSNFVKPPKTARVDKKKVKESEAEKQQRLAKLRERKQLYQQEKAQKKQQEEHAKRIKEERDRDLQKSIELANKVAQISQDSRLLIIEHNLEIMAEAIRLFQDPKTFDLILSCSGDENLLNELLIGNAYELLVYYPLLHCVMRSAHSLGQLMISYQQFDLIELQPYRVRNNLMHKSFDIGLDKLKLLVDAAGELNDQFREIVPIILHHGFQDLVKSIKLQNTLFSEKMLISLEEKNLDVNFSLSQLKLHLQHWHIMGKVVRHIYSKDASKFLEHCGLLHHAIIGVICGIGEILNQLQQLDYAIYNKIVDKILLQTEFKKTGSGYHTLFQEIRIKVGHFFSENFKNIQIPFNPNARKELFRELSPQAIYDLSRTTEKLLNNISEVISEFLMTPFFKPKMNANAAAFVPENFNNNNNNQNRAG